MASHDDIDPQSGQLTPEAQAWRNAIRDKLGVGTWVEAANHPEFQAAISATDPEAEPTTESEAVEAAEVPADGDAEPGAVQEASQEAFQAEVTGEAEADIPQATPG